MSTASAQLGAGPLPSTATSRRHFVFECYNHHAFRGAWPLTHRHLVRSRARAVRHNKGQSDRPVVATMSFASVGTPSSGVSSCTPAAASMSLSSTAATDCHRASRRLPASEASALASARAWRSFRSSCALKARSATVSNGRTLCSAVLHATQERHAESDSRSVIVRQCHQEGIPATDCHANWEHLYIMTLSVLHKLQRRIESHRQTVEHGSQGMPRAHGT
jgi:hypothetical protein